MSSYHGHFDTIGVKSKFQWHVVVYTIVLLCRVLCYTIKNGGPFPHGMNTTLTVIVAAHTCRGGEIASRVLWRLCHPGPVLFFKETFLHFFLTCSVLIKDSLGVFQCKLTPHIKQIDKNAIKGRRANLALTNLIAGGNSEAGFRTAFDGSPSIFIQYSYLDLYSCVWLCCIL
jgi:hypothetical protein